GRSECGGHDRLNLAETGTLKGVRGGLAVTSKQVTD
ncbi:hypothetical protein A2U01_0069361, partial [Trifolium medium]|nr:hypothetical protein [Trifolium medium]